MMIRFVAERVADPDPSILADPDFKKARILVQFFKRLWFGSGFFDGLAPDPGNLDPDLYPGNLNPHPENLYTDQHQENLYTDPHPENLDPDPYPGNLNPDPHPENFYTDPHQENLDPDPQPLSGKRRGLSPLINH